MWEIQPDWPQLNTFYIMVGDTKFHLSRIDGQVTTNDTNCDISTIQNRSFTFACSKGQCSFYAPKKVLKIHSGDSVNCVDVSPDGHEILSGDSKGRLFLTYVGTDPVPLLGPSDGFDVECCIFDSAHKLFFACGGDFRIYEYSATEYQEKTKLIGHKSSVKHISVLQNHLFSGSYDSTICKWDIEKSIRVSTMQMNGRVNNFCFTANDLIVAATENSLRSVDLKTGLPAAAPNFGKSASFNCVATNGDNVVAGTDDGVVALWDLRNTDQTVTTWSWYDSPINKLKYSKDRLWVATNDGTAACINLIEKKSIAILGTQAYAPVRDIAFNDFSIWTADGEGSLYYFEL